MLRRYFWAAALMLLALLTAPAMMAQGNSPYNAEGTWIFHVHIDGAPPCECIQMLTFYSDGHLDGPGNDQFSGQVRGQWVRTGTGHAAMTFAQNNFNPDGSAGGVWVIKATMDIDQSGNATGLSTSQLLDNSGAVTFSATASFTGTKIVAGQ